MKTPLFFLVACGVALAAQGQTAPIGPNLAAGKPVEVSSVENAGTPGRNAVDGNYASRWSSAFSDPQWLYVDLGAPTPITKVRINWEAAYGKDYQVQFSNDAQTWTTVRTVTGNTARINLISGLAGSAQYVRIRGTARGTGYGYSIYELEVSGSNTPPTVQLTQPAANSTYSGPVRLAANAADPDGAVSKVDFYVDNVLVGTDDTSPYEATWTSFSPGRHVAKAVATDDNGATTTSLEREFYGDANTPPTVQLTAPAANSTYSGQRIRLAATATDPDGSVARVEFCVGDPTNYRILGADTNSPYEYDWLNVAPGTYQVFARAFDNQGAATTSFSRTFYVINDPFNKSIPGQIEAERYDAMRGVATETTADAGGGENVGYLDAGDWLDYSVNVAAAGTYTVQFRVAGFAAGAQLQLQSGATVLSTVAVPTTGGGQSWTTVSATAALPAGSQTLRVAVLGGGFNFNWMSFSAASAAQLALSQPAPAAASIVAYPNPGPGRFRVAGVPNGTTATVHNAAGFPVATTTVHDGALDLGTLQPGTYLVRLRSQGRTVQLRLRKE
ncbi:Ig-like domain-containing protein [Hymenobacter weizhouensis]|uniref:Ig-like domain-containing protein n=1 Tax=Hymenobacter sp. YIM 151500-1 TaxID=2987689 RepID=UPI0022278BA5|nr:Ig-like domain-containing protein [Hymenobacter sp. YIM 151500-1]UYZ63091.1 Ig-like domain-containing protein [Hymenobacter sp. YIM 151500-1]